MRMWNLPVERMCDKHLLGEHVEMHMFAGTLIKGKSIKGYVDNGLVETGNIKNRHNEIAREMLNRRMSHKSKIQKFKIVRMGKINVKKNIKELIKRCKNCRKKLK